MSSDAVLGQQPVILSLWFYQPSRKQIQGQPVRSLDFDIISQDEPLFWTVIGVFCRALERR